MKIYYICECCDEVFNMDETGSGEGGIELRGICNDCAMELGMQESPTATARHFYS